MKAINLLLVLIAVSCASNQPHEIGTTPISMKMTGCYEKSDSLHHNREGIVEISMVVTKEGKTKDAKIDRSDFEEQALKECILQALQYAEYLPVSMDTTIKQSFHFHKVK